MEGNSEAEKKTETATTKISAVPKYDIEIKRNASANILGYYNPENNTATADYVNDGDLYGRLQYYTLSLRLQNDSASKGMKGIEFPDGSDITFDLRMSESVNDKDVSNDKDYKPIFWDYAMDNGSKSKGNLGRPMSPLGQDIASYGCWTTNTPYNNGNDNGRCYNGGQLKIITDETDSNLLHATLSGYQIDTKNFDFPNRWAGSDSKKIADNIGYISVCGFQLIGRFKTSVDEIENVGIILKAENFHARSISGIDVESEVDKNNNISSVRITNYPSGYHSKRNFYFLENGSYARPSVWYAGDSYAYIGEKLRIIGQMIYTGDSYLQATNILQKFDDTAFDIPKGTTRYLAYGRSNQLTEIGHINTLFAAKPDKSGWKDDTEMNDTHEEQLIYFKSIDDLHNAGYTCVGVLYEVRNSKLYPNNAGGCLSIDMLVEMKDTIKSGKVYMTKNDVRSWRAGTDYTYLDTPYDESIKAYGIGNAEWKNGVYADDYVKPTYRTDLNYEKAVYKNGTMVSGHTNGYEGGNSVLIIGNKTAININVKEQEHTLIYTNKDSADLEKEDHIVTVTLTSDSGFQDGQSVNFSEIKDKDTLNQYLSSLDSDVLKKENKEVSDTILAADIGIKAADGSLVETNENTEVRIDLNGADEFEDYLLYHYKEDGTWERINFTAHKTDEESYLEFVTKSFSPFLFVKTKELETQSVQEQETKKSDSEQNEKEKIKEETTQEAQPISKTQIAQNENNTVASDVHIRSLSTSLFRGAKKNEKGVYVWTAQNDKKGHAFSYRIRYSVSGVGMAPAGTINLTVPKHTLSDRNGNWADTYEMSIPSKVDVEAAEAGTGEAIDTDIDYAYYEDGDNIVIYNFREVPAGDNGYIEMSYDTSDSTFTYVDCKEQAPFTCTMTVKNSTGTETKTADPIVTAIDTTAEIKSTYKNYPTKYKKWDSSWGTEVMPEDPEKYQYLIWRIDSTMNATQPYDFNLEDVVKGNHGGMEVLGFRFSGQSSFQRSGMIKDQKGTEKRYDYVLTSIPLETYQSYDYWKAENKITATVTPIDQVDPATEKKSSNVWTWTRPEFTIPTGHFNLYKRADGAYRTFGSNIYSGTTHLADSLGMNAGEYSRYDLEEFSGHDNTEITKTQLDGLDYASWLVGYPYPWTYDPDSKNPMDPEAYGKKPVTYELIDEGVYLNNDAGGKDEEKTGNLTSEDFAIKELNFTTYMQDAEFDEDEQKFQAVPVTLTDSDVLTFYGKFGGSDTWTQFATYNLKTKEKTVDSNYVASMTSSKFTMTDQADMTAYKITTSNTHYFSEIFTRPVITLKNSKTVMDFVKDKKSIGIKNHNEGHFYQYDGKEILKLNEEDTDFTRVAKRDSSITKKAVAASNNTKKKYYSLTWKVEDKDQRTGRPLYRLLRYDTFLGEHQRLWNSRL